MEAPAEAPADALRSGGREGSPILAALLLAVPPTMADSPATPLPQPGIGVGTWAWGNQFLWGYNPDQDQALQATFEQAILRGLRFFDTADSYGTGRFNGRSEQLLGAFCAAVPAPERHEIQVATKLAPFPWRLGRRGLHPAFTASRARLQGQLDRVQLHWSTARYAPWQEVALLDGLADLVEAGMVPELGLSNVGPRRLRWMQKRLTDRGVAIASLQVQFSLLAPAPLVAGGVVETCRELGIPLIAYSPLALGLLARSPDPAAPSQGLRGPRRLLFRRLEPALAPLRQVMAAMAAPRGAPLAAVALNWCRAHGAMPIPGLRTPEQVEVAAAAATWSLTTAERLELDRLALAPGPRMPANPFQSA